MLALRPVGLPMLDCPFVASVAWLFTGVVLVLRLTGSRPRRLGFLLIITLGTGGGDTGEAIVDCLVGPGALAGIPMNLSATV